MLSHPIRKQSRRNRPCIGPHPTRHDSPRRSPWRTLCECNDPAVGLVHGPGRRCPHRSEWHELRRLRYAEHHDSVLHPVPDDACGPRLGLLAKIKAKLASLKPNFGHSACASECAAPVVACAPVCETKSCGTPLIRRPIFTGFTTACADPCKVGLLSRLKAKFAGLHSCNACAAPAAPTCCGSSTVAQTTVTGTVTAPPVVAAPAPATPAVMPK